MLCTLPGHDLTDGQFSQISALVRDLCGINLHAGKRQLVRARLTRRLRELSLPSFDAYLELLRDDESELVALLDVISTNLTRFFRERSHFDVIVDRLRAAADDRPSPTVRIWSAGCSSGEEPYSLAIEMHEAFDDLHLWDAKILATDLSTRMLATARAGVYSVDRLTDVSNELRERHFKAVPGDGQRYRVAEHIRRMVHFARLNLMDEWPMRGPFDAILCRNVMIYFEKATQQRLVNRFHEKLRRGGLLLIGHSESLTGVKHPFRYVQPTVYEKR